MAADKVVTPESVALDPRAADESEGPREKPDVQVGA
jgi:hypothetical protein